MVWDINPRTARQELYTSVERLPYFKAKNWTFSTPKGEKERCSPSCRTEGIISVMHSSPWEQFFLWVISKGGDHQQIAIIITE